MLLMPPRHGKALAVGTLVPTPGGFRSVESLVPGDFVFGRDGRPTRVVARSPIWRDRELFEVVSDDGASVVVDAEHEWTVRLCRKRPVFKTKATSQLASRGSPRNPALMTYSAVEHAEAELPIHPYVLGVWLGDGCSAHATVTQGAQDYDFIRTEVELCGHLTTDRSTLGTFGVQGLHTSLATLGLLRDKHIPESYLAASVAQRHALLQGLIDTDGYVAPDGQVEFCSVSQRLAEDVLQLVRSLGVKASMVLGDATLNGKFISRKYRVMFYMAGAARLPRKAMRCRDNMRTPHRFLTFKPAGRGDTVCIQVEAEDHQYLVGEGYLLTHNSEIASRNFPAWHLGQYPDHEVIACSYSLALAMSFSRKVKQIIEDPLYPSVFDVHLDPNNSSTEEWGISQHRGAYVAAGIGGPITGKGAHVLVIDDPVKNAEEADSPDNREKIWNWYLSTADTRLAPGGGVLIIQTWWHDDDLAGRLQNLMKVIGTDNEDADTIDQYEIVKYPAMAEAEEYLNLVTDQIEYDPEAPDPTTYRLLRHKGEALHSDRYPIERLRKIRLQNRTIDGTDGRWWNALYQQNPVPDDGGHFQKSQFRRAAAPSKKISNCFIAWDFAISEKKQNDYTVGTVVLQDYDDVLHVVDQVRFRSRDSFYIVESILNLAAKWSTPSLQLGFEDGQIYRSLESLLKKRMQERGMYPPVTLLQPITDKLARSSPLKGRMQQGMVSFAEGAPWFDGLRTEMLRFPAGAHDDQVDSLAWAVHMAVGRRPPQRPKGKEQPSWRDKLALTGVGVSHMAA